MGFKKPSLDTAYSAVRHSLMEIHSPYNDGFVTSNLKQELYQLKCWLEDEYNKLPEFVGEDKWEQDRIVQILKR
jgi:hypothetical protein